MSKNIAYPIIVVFALGLFSYGAILNKKDDRLDLKQEVVSASPIVEAKSTINTEGLLEGGSTIKISNQNVADKIVVDFFVLDKPGFVVVSDNDELGVSELLPKGEYKEKVINLINKPSSKILKATLYEDNGDGNFSASDDKIVKDEVGKEVSMNFNIIPLSSSN